MNTSEAITTLGANIDFWNIVYVSMMFLTIVAAAGIFMAQSVTIRQLKLLDKLRADIAASESKEKDAKIASANEGAETAKKDAAKANERASESDRKAAEAVERTAALTKEAAALRAEAEKERLARVKIEHVMAPRGLNPRQLAGVITGLHPLAKTKVNLSRFSGAMELARYATQISAALKSAGLEVVGDRIVTSGVSVQGVVIVTDPQADPQAIKSAQLIAVALGGIWQAIKEDPAGAYFGNRDGNVHIDIWVGDK